MIRSKPKRILFKSQKKTEIPQKTKILKEFLKDPPTKIGEYRKYKLANDVLAVLKKEKRNVEALCDYYKLTVVKNKKQKNYFVKEVKSPTYINLLRINGYNEFLAQTSQRLKADLKQMGVNLIDTYYGFHDNKTNRNFVVTRYYSKNKYITLDEYYSKKKINTKKYIEYRKKIKKIYEELQAKGHPIYDLGTHNTFINLETKELTIFDIMLDLRKYEQKN
jgi:hypothetical protein